MTGIIIWQRISNYKEGYLWSSKEYLKQIMEFREEFNVELFNQFAKFMRYKGWIETKSMIAAGIKSGHALEIGPGPGIKGLEWLKSTTETRLTALEISEDMIKVAQRNAEEYGLVDRVEYINGNATTRMPFEDNFFDTVFSNGSLHEWEFPERVLNEIHRVLKPGGMLFISDLRRDMNVLMKLIVKLSTKPKEMIPGFITSMNASYTVDEIKVILGRTDLRDYKVSKDPIGLSVVAKKL